MTEYTNLTKEDIKNKKIAAFDYGEKKVGVATTDIFHITFNPIATIENNEKLFEKITQIVSKENIDICIVGYPIRTNNTESSIHKKILLFMEQLQSNTGLRCCLYDESLSSKIAKKNMIESGIPQKKRKVKQNLDKFAAMIILKNFIEEIEG